MRVGNSWRRLNSQNCLSRDRIHKGIGTEKYFEAFREICCTKRQTRGVQIRQDLMGACSVAGQFVMDGFLDLRVKKWGRVLVTWLVAIVPTIILALAFDSSENELDNLSEWLNVLQSIQLPFALIPLLCLVSNTRVMGVFVISKVTNVRHGLETLSSTINLYALSLLLCITQLRTQLVNATGVPLLWLGFLFCNKFCPRISYDHCPCWQ